MLTDLLVSICNSTGIDLQKDAEVLIIDDASQTKFPSAYLQRFKGHLNIMITRNKHPRGASASRNIGFKLSKGKYVLFIDDDNVVSPTFISNLIKVIEMESSVGMAGGITCYFSDPNRIQYAAWRINLSKRGFIFGNITYETCKSIQNSSLLRADYIPNAFLLRRELISNVGGFDEKLKVYYEDADFGYRVKKAGYNIIVVPHAKIYHKSTGSIFKDPEKIYMQLKNRAYFLRKHSTLTKFSVIMGSCALSLRFIASIMHSAKGRGRLKGLLYLLRATFEVILNI